MNGRGLELYKKTAKASETPRETEARVLTQGALKLKYCMENWETVKKEKTLSEALRYNQQIWSIFQADLSAADSRLPTDLRLNLLRLGAFVDRQIFSILADPVPEKLESIIRVNLHLAAGLRKNPPRETDQSAANSSSTGVTVKG